MAGFDSISAERPLILIGGGRMGAALLAGWLDRGLAAEAVVVVEPDAAAADRIRAARAGVRVIAESEQTGSPAVVVLAVKPQVMDAAIAPLRALDAGLFLSIAAGKTLDYFSDALGADTALVRAMPNTPAAIGKGMTVCVGNNRVSPDQRALCSALMSAVGEVAWLDSEALMDAVTALSGSGPAYVFHLVECMAAAGEALGLPSDQAQLLARQTVAGAGALVAASPDASATELRQNVTSPGGTTEAALNVLMDEEGLATLMRHALEAAARRSKELSG